MKIGTLQERIEKNKTKIQKKQELIQKREVSMEKKVSKLNKDFNFKYEGKRFGCDQLEEMGFNRDDAWNIYWTICEIQELEESIQKDLPRQIEETKKTLAKQEAQLAGEIKKESIFITEVPESMKELERQLVIEWDKWDQERKERLTAKYKELGYSKFMKKYSFADYNFIHTDDEKIHEDNQNLARLETIDLYNRIKDITGEVTDWSYMTIRQGNVFPVLTGYVVGKEGKAHVETIHAGGYNIQRLHIRTLVHEL